MNCVNCYQEIPDGTKFCPHCGTKQPEPSVEQPLNDGVTGDFSQGEGELGQEQSSQGYDYQNQGQSEQSYSYQNDEQPEQSYGYQSEGQSEQSYGYQNQGQQGQGYGYQNQGQQGQGYGYQNQGQVYQNNGYQNSQQPPINWVPYLVLSIISTLCCCMPFGIVGIVYAAKINSEIQSGNVADAQDAANKAKMWIIVSVVVGVVVNVIGFALGLFSGLTSTPYYY